MKKIVIILSVLLFTGITNINAQTFRALLVNDNSVFYYNTDSIINALNATGLTFDKFNARDSLRSPSQAEMAPYDLVIWYCSTDGVGNFLWDGTDSDNMELMAYLEGGGYLWLMGNDFLYDRYAVPYSFSAGEFAYDYLGTLQYNAQSYGDDGGFGVSELDLTEPSFSTLESIHWIFPTAWWIDACTPVSSASALYIMGPAEYTLAGYASAIRYASGGHLAITFFFDPALIDTYGNRVQLFTDVINYFTTFAGNHELTVSSQRARVSPNPASDYAEITVPGEVAARDIRINMTDLNGRALQTSRSMSPDHKIRIDVSGMRPGMYILKIQSGTATWTEKLIVKQGNRSF